MRAIEDGRHTVAAHRAVETCFFNAGQYKPSGRAAGALEPDGYTWRYVIWLLRLDLVTRAAAKGISCGTRWALQE